MVKHSPKILAIEKKATTKFSVFSKYLHAQSYLRQPVCDPEDHGWLRQMIDSSSVIVLAGHFPLHEASDQ